LGDAERVGLAVQVEAGDLGERDALVEVVARRPGETPRRVAEPDQLTAQVAHVDALATAEGLLRYDNRAIRKALVHRKILSAPPPVATRE
jgi:hypothetical protein